MLDSHSERQGLQGVLQKFTVNGKSEEVEKKIEEARPWLAGNELTLNKIIDVTPSNILPLVQDLSYTKQAWKALCETYQHKNTMHATSLIGDIASY